MTVNPNFYNIIFTLGSLGCLLAFFLERLFMSSFLRSLFGSKKSNPKSKHRMQTRRLELLDLEERITPATVSVSGTDVLITLGAGENISDLNTITATAVITVNTVGSANNTLVGTPTGVSFTNNTVVINTAAFTTFTGIQVLGSNTTNAVTVGAAGINLTAGTTANTNQTVAINLSFNSGTGTLNVNGPIQPKNAGNVGLNSTTVTIAGLGDITATTGSVNITGNTITSAGDVTSTGPLTLTGTGDVSVSGQIFVGSVNATSSNGDVIFGNTVVTQIGGFTSEATLATKATKIANLVTVGAGANALVTGNLITNNATLAAITTSGAGKITITGNVDASVANNKLTLAADSGAIAIIGNVGSGAIAFGTLTASGTGTFLAAGTVAAGSIKLDQANKFATSITFAKAVTVSDSSGGIEVNASGSGTVTFSDTITALGATSNDTDIEIISVNGAINVGGAITGLDKVAIISSGSGSISLIGNVTTSGISTTQDNGLIKVESTTGNITTVGVISTTGSLANINIDTATSGNITIGGNVATSGGDIFLGADSTSSATGTGNLTINGTVSTTGSFTGDVVIGTGGTGTVTVNQAISSKDGNIYLLAKGNQTNALNFSKDATITAGVGVVFSTTGPANTISLASGANITAVEGVTDDISGTGSLNLASNITVTNSTLPVGIILDNVSINLTGAVSMKTIGVGSDITLASVNGAQNLTLEAPAVVGSTITLASVGQTTALNTVTVINSGDVLFNGAFTAANVVLLDTNDAVIFNGQTVISNSLTTTVEAYDVTFNTFQTVVLNGAPVFLNTGDVQFFGTNTVLPSGATIAGGSLANVNLAGTIVSGGAFNIGAGLAGINVSDNTQLILNSITASSTFASPINLNAGSVGAFNLLGAGTLTLSANSTGGVTTGDTINVTNGTLNVTGTLGSASTITLTNGTLTGPGGTVGNLTPANGTVDPEGTLNTGVVTFNAATTYIADVLTTTTASNLTGNTGFNLGGATLSLSSVASGLAAGNTFTIINNTAVSGGLSGTFAGLPEGSSISAFDASGNIVTFTVSYIGGTNANDVTLTVASITPQTPTPSAAPQPMVAGQPALNKFTAVGADAGAGPLVTITFQNGTYVSFFAYAPSFKGGVRVAIGDVNGDGSPDIITGAGAGGGPQVDVYNVNNSTGAVSLQTSFFAFDEPFFAGGVYVAAGDTNDDGFDDVVVGAGAGGGPRVQVYAGSATGLVTSSTLNDFFAYSLAFTGGVVVAAGDRNADGDSEVITAPASNGGFNIKSFDVNGNGNSPTLVDNFFAFNDTTSVGGLSLAVGFFDFTNIADLVVGTTNSAFGVFLDSDTSGIATVPFAGFTGAIRAGVAEDSFGQEYAVALAGPTGGPRISVFSVGATSLTETDNLFVMNTSFKGGLFGTSTLGD